MGDRFYLAQLHRKKSKHEKKWLRKQREQAAKQSDEGVKGKS